MNVFPSFSTLGAIVDNNAYRALRFFMPIPVEDTIEDKGYMGLDTTMAEFKTDIVTTNGLADVLALCLTAFSTAICRDRGGKDKPFNRSITGVSGNLTCSVAP